MAFDVAARPSTTDSSLTEVRVPQSLFDAMTILNDRLPELLRLTQFEDLDKAKSIVKKAVDWDRKTPYNYDPRWIALHGIRYFLPVPADGHQDPLTIPEDQWEALAEELRTGTP